MELRDRTLLKALMEQRGYTTRELSTLAGWKSHTYLQRLIRGEKTSLKTEPAARIAVALEVPFDLLFVTKVSNGVDRSVRSGRAA